MKTMDFLQVVLVFGLLLLLVRPVGSYMARIYRGEYPFVMQWLRPVERCILQLSGIDEKREMHWAEYCFCILLFSMCSLLSVFAIARWQSYLPLNPEQLPSVESHTAWNTAISFATNTNWQSYGGESTMSYFTQMIALTVQNFVSAAVGMSVLVALIRAFHRQECNTIGNVWVDVTRTVLYILLPASFLLSLILIWQGVPQTFSRYQEASELESFISADNAPSPRHKIAIGPVASQVAIKQLGTNGGGFFNVNSAHPFENPTPLSNLVELIAILLIPAALCWMFGEMIRDRRQGIALLSAMFVVLVPLLIVALIFEHQSNPLLQAAGAEGGNMEGKEVRFGITNSILWSIATTATSNGSVNSMHDSMSPIAGMVTMWLIQLGEVVFGGVGSGLYGMLVFAMVAVFIAGLMVGRTPEYLGKKIGVFEMKMSSLVILIPCATTLLATSLSVSLEPGRSGVSNTGPHGFSEILYAYSSAANNNGSAFAGLNANTPFHNGLLGVVMLIGRFWVLVPVLAMAGSIANKKLTPASNGTLPTHTPLFVALLCTTILIIGSLSFLPALALGPIAEYFLVQSSS